MYRIYNTKGNIIVLVWQFSLTKNLISLAGFYTIFNTLLILRHSPILFGPPGVWWPVLVAKFEVRPSSVGYSHYVSFCRRYIARILLYSVNNMFSLRYQNFSVAFFAFSLAALSVIVSGQLNASSEVDRNEINRLLVNAVAELKAEFSAQLAATQRQLDSSNDRLTVLESRLAAMSANSHECKFSTV